MSETAALDLLRAFVLDDGRRWGEVAHPFQVEDAGAVLDQSPGAPRRHWWGRARGMSKTSDLSGVGCAALLAQLPPLSRSYAYAADREQSGLLLESASGFVARTPEVSSLVVGAGSVSNSRTGAQLIVQAADDAGAFGQRPHMTLIDEFGVWPTTRRHRGLWVAVVSALPKVPGSRLVVLSMGGSPSHPAYKVLERARASDAWKVAEHEGPCPWWSEEDVAEVRADLTTETDYQRLVLGRWVEGEDRLTTVDDVRACVRQEGPLEWERGHRYVMGLDIGLVNDATVLTVAHLERFDESSVVVVDRQWAWHGSKGAPVDLSLVEATIMEAHLAYGRPTLVLDPFQGELLSQRLRRRSVRVEAYNFNQGSISRLAGTMYELLSGRLLDLPDDEALVDELAAARIIERAPGLWRIDHDQGGHDDRVISIALCARHLLTARHRGVRFRPVVGLDEWEVAR